MDTNRDSFGEIITKNIGLLDAFYIFQVADEIDLKWLKNVTIIQKQISLMYLNLVIIYIQS